MSVEPSQVAAARLLITMLAKDGEPIDPELWAVAGGDQRAAADDGLRARVEALVEQCQREHDLCIEHRDLRVHIAAAALGGIAGRLRDALDPPTTAAPCTARHDVTDDGVTAGWFCTLTEAHDEHQDSQSRRWVQ